MKASDLSIDVGAGVVGRTLLVAFEEGDAVARCDVSSGEIVPVQDTMRRATCVGKSQ